MSVDIKMALFTYPLVVASTNFSTVYVIDKFRTDERGEKTSACQQHCCKVTVWLVEHTNRAQFVQINRFEVSRYCRHLNETAFC